MKTDYHIYCEDDWEFRLLDIVKENKYEGFMWPNSDHPHFLLKLTDEELLWLSLRVPIRAVRQA